MRAGRPSPATRSSVYRLSTEPRRGDCRVSDPSRKAERCAPGRVQGVASWAPQLARDLGENQERVPVSCSRLPKAGSSASAGRPRWPDTPMPVRPTGRSAGGAAGGRAAQWHALGDTRACRLCPPPRATARVRRSAGAAGTGAVPPPAWELDAGDADLKAVPLQPEAPQPPSGRQRIRTQAAVRARFHDHGQAADDAGDPPPDARHPLMKSSGPRLAPRFLCGFWNKLLGARKRPHWRLDFSRFDAAAERAGPPGWFRIFSFIHT